MHSQKERPVEGEVIPAGGIDWGPVGAAIAFVALAATALIYQHGLFIKQLADRGDRSRIRAELTTDAPAGRRFRNGIDGLLNAVEWYFGPAHRWRAFDRCLLHAYLYPIVFFVIAWAAGAPGALGVIDVFKDIPIPERVWHATLLVAGLAIAVGWSFFVFRRIDRIEAWTRAILDRVWKDGGSTRQSWVLRVQNGLIELSAVIIAGPIAFALVGAGAGAGAGALAFAGGVAVIGVFTVALALAGVAAAAAAFAFSAVVFSAVFLAFAGDLPTADVVTLMVFCAALPIANAVLDWLSWIITRWLLRRPGDSASGARLVLGISFRLLFDLAFAFASLCLLVIVLPNTIELANPLFAAIAWPTIDWLHLLNQAVEAPFTRGLFVTGMLLTTLVPTLLHVIAGLFGVFAVWTFGAREVATLIPDDHAGNMLPSAQQRIAWLLIRRRLWLIPATLCCLPLVAVLAAILSVFTGPIGLFLADLALCATSWSHGLCTW